MEAVIGKVQGFDGEFFAKDADGSIVTLKNGDSIVEGMTVFGDKNNPQNAYINIAMLNTGELLVISGVEEQLFDSSVNKDEMMDAALAEESVSGAEGVLAALEDSEKSAEDGVENADEETAAGEEDGQTTDGKEASFLARDGDSTDVNTDLRVAEFDAAVNNPEATPIIPEDPAVDYISVAGESFATVDDDGLENGNPLSMFGDDDANINDVESVFGIGPVESEQFFSGTLNFTATGDFPVTVDLASMDGQTGTVGTETVVYNWDATFPFGGVLFANVDGGYRDGQPLFAVGVVEATGEYTIVLYDNVMHPTLDGLDGDNTENNVDVPLNFTVTDNNGSTANGTLTVNFDDDMPTIDVGLAGVGSVQGVVISQDGDVTVAQGDIVSEGSGTSVDQWSFTHKGGPLTIDMLSEKYNEDIDGDGDTSSLDIMIYLFDSTGHQIAYNDDSGLTFADGSETGLDSYIHLSSLPAGEYTLSVGGYHLSNPEALNDHNTSGSVGTYQITFTGDIENVYQADGIPTLTTQDAETIGTDSDTATASFASMFTITQDMGADDYDYNDNNYDDGSRVVMYTPSSSLSYALSVTTADSGLTSEGEAIMLSVNGAGVIEGRTSATEAIFTVSVNPLTGEVTLTQNSEIDHFTESDTDLNGIMDDNAVSNLGLVTGNVVLTASASITDADGDTATDSQGLDISSAISFDDDVPSVDVGLLYGGDFNLPTLTTQDAETIGLDSDTDSSSLFAGLFTLTQDIGADDLEPGDSGEASLSYSLSVAVGSEDSGLTSEGEAIMLSVNSSGVLEGRTSASEAIFTVSVDSVTGEVTLTQNSVIDHTDETADGNSSNNDVNNLGLLSGNVVLTASATITDDDGDVDTASQDLDISSAISFDDDVPTIDKNEMVQLDDETLQPDGISGTVYTDGSDVDPDTENTRGELSHDYGADGEGTVLLSGLGAPTGFEYDLSTDGQTLNIYQGTVATGTLVVEVALDDATSGLYTVTQKNPVDHTLVDTEDNVDFDIKYVVTDGDGDTAEGTMNIDVDDDSPEASAEAGATASVGLDETALDGQTSIDDTISATNIAALFSAPLGFGADGAAATGSVAYALDATDEAATGLYLVGGTTEIQLVENGGVYEGRVGGTGGAKAFQVEIDSATGEVTVTQYEAMDHPDDPDDVTADDNPVDTVLDHEDTPLNLDGLIKVTQTLTDKDGDTDTATSENALDITFADDGPDANAAGVDGDAPTASTGTDLDETGGLDTATIIATDITGLFDTPDYGADGAAATNSVVYSLSATDTATGLFLTSDQAHANEIELVATTNGYEGLAGGIGGTLAFSVLINPVTGTVTVTQADELDHPLEGANHNDTLNLDGLIKVVQTVTDADSDVDTATSHNALDIVFYDDGPTAATPDIDLVSQFTMTNHDEVSSAGYHNSYGYYIKDAVTGEPTTGVIVWDDVHDTDTVPVTVSGYTKDEVGFFIIPNGENTNGNYDDNTPVTFVQLPSGEWQAVITATSTPIIGEGSHVLFDNQAFNVDGYDHVQDNELIGNQNWEDLQIANDDNDFNDVNINVTWLGEAAILDESDIPNPTEDPVINDGSEDGVYSAMVDVSGAFTGAAAGSYGADGPGTTSYNLELNLIDPATEVGSGLFILDNTQADGKGAEIMLVDNGDGTVSGMDDTTKVFTISIDNNGELTFAYENQTDPANIWHRDTVTGDDAESLITDPDTLVVTQTITDADGDSATSAGLDVGTGEFFKIEDDGPSMENPQDAILTNEIGNVLTGADLGIDFGTDGAKAVAAIVLTPEVDDDGHAVESNGTTKLTSTVDNGDGGTVTYNLVYVQNADGSVTAYQDTTGGDAVFTLTPDVATGTYSVSIVGQLDGQAYTTGNIFDSNNAVGGGNTDALLFELDGLHVLATGRNGSYIDADVDSVNHSNANGLAVSQMQKIEDEDILILNFTDDTVSLTDYDGDGTLFPDEGNNGLDPSYVPDIEDHARDASNAIYLTAATFTLGQFASDDTADWVAYKDGSVVASGSLDYNATLTDTFTITEAGGFNEVRFTAADASTEYTVLSMYASNGQDFPAVDHTINVSVAATDGDGDIVYERDALEVTFDGDGVIDYAADTVIDGGDGYDALVLSSNDLVLDFSDEVVDNITDIEVIDMTAVESQTINGLSLDDVVDMTSGIDNGVGGLLHSLEIVGNSGDTVNLDSSGWTLDNTIDGATTNTYEYTDTNNNSIALTVDDDVVVI